MLFHVTLFLRCRLTSYFSDTISFLLLVCLDFAGKEDINNQRIQ